MSDASFELLEELTRADGVPGHEREVAAVFERRLAGVGAIRRDRLGSVACIRKGPEGGPRILLDSHMDEVGFIVQRVTARGYVKIVAAGGWWSHTLLAQRVRIGTAQGKVPGIIGSTPPHLLSAEARERVMKLEDLFIDIGAKDRAEAEAWGVRPGCPVAPHTPLQRLHEPNLLTAKALDNRVGVALVIEALRDTDDHPNTLIGAGCVQEEVGLRGARTLAPVLEPDLAIVLEAPPADDTPGFDPDAAQGVLGRGVQIRLFDPTMIAHPGLAEFVVESAQSRGIAHQIAVRQTGGTNAGAIHQSPGGVPAIVLGVPTRYIHSHVSIIHLDDYAAAKALLHALVAGLDKARFDAICSA
jgi:putative aminopeptidase FrvX